MNLEAFQKTRARIATEPEEAFNMGWYHSEVDHPCGTSFCIAGHAMLAHGAVYHPDTQEFSIRGNVISASDGAKDFLGLNWSDGWDLFNGRRNIGAFRATKAEVLQSLDIIIEDEDVNSPRLIDLIEAREMEFYS